MQRVRLLERIGNIFLLGEKAVLRRKVFTMEGHGKGNGIPCITVGDREHDEVRKLKNFGWTLAANTSNKLSQPVEKGRYSNLGFGR